MEIDMPERVEDVSTEPHVPAADSPIEQPAAPAQASLPGTEPPTPAEAPPKPEPKSLTIGAVCKSLEREFPDISISKIRYLEDQKLLTPRRTRGGYRLYSPADVDRLRTILRLQRDEFLPLRVIRQELASPVGKERKRRRGLADGESQIGLEELCGRAGISQSQARELVEFGLLEAPFADADIEAAAVSARLVAAGADLRHLRRFVTAAGNQADLLEALVPKLRSRNPEARQGALEDLGALAELAQELSQLLFWRALRHRVVEA